MSDKPRSRLGRKLALIFENAKGLYREALRDSEAELSSNCSCGARDQAFASHDLECEGRALVLKDYPSLAVIEEWQ